MSIALMTEVWRLDMPTTDKMVLLALADAANDDGVTWMALESREGVKLDLLKKTSLSRRAVQGALVRLCAAGYLTRVDRPGKGVIWTVRGCTSCAPQQMRPAADAPGGAADAPKPSTNRQPTSEAKASSVVPPAPQAKTRPIPPDWSPSKPDIDYAASKGLTPQETERAAEDFRDYFVAAGAGKRSTDWSLNWKRWVRTTVDDQPRRGSGTSSRQAAGGQRPKPVSMAGILAERRGRAPVSDDVSDDGWLLRTG